MSLEYSVKILDELLNPVYSFSPATEDEYSIQIQRAGSNVELHNRDFPDKWSLIYTATEEGEE